MKLSSKCRYGVRAVLEIAHNYEIRPTKRREIAAKQDLNDSYLENILLDLKNKDIMIQDHLIKFSSFLQQHEMRKKKD